MNVLSVGKNDFNLIFVSSKLIEKVEQVKGVLTSDFKARIEKNFDPHFSYQIIRFFLIRIHLF